MQTLLQLHRLDHHIHHLLWHCGLDRIGNAAPLALRIQVVPTMHHCEWFALGLLEQHGHASGLAKQYNDMIRKLQHKENQSNDQHIEHH